MSSALHPSSSQTLKEEDIANKASPYFEHEHELLNPPQYGPSKGKEREVNFGSPGTSSEHLEETAYPPTNEAAEETRRIEENLRRWEVAERQRRRAARGSSQSSNTTSLVTDVSRRASLLWSSKRNRNPSLGGIGVHTALQSQDNIDTVPLNKLAASPTPSPTRSDSIDSTSTTNANNPFAHPEDSSPFTDTHQIETIKLHAASAPESVPTFMHNQTLRPPPPQPLNLPPPRTPPPTLGPPSPPVPHSTNGGRSEQEVRWWHDWLCGCSEGTDRGGDYQAGRTNPFE